MAGFRRTWFRNIGQDRTRLFYHELDATAARFRRVLGQAKSEAPIHRFLTENPILLLNGALGSRQHVPYERTAIFSKPRLGAEFVPDFALVYANSDGAHWAFIELEPGHVPPYTKAGTPSRRLAGAIRQVNQWRAWLDENREYATKALATLQMGARIHRVARWRRKPEFAIIMGRRAHLHEAALEARSHANDDSKTTTIMSYDRLLDGFIATPDDLHWSEEGPVLDLEGSMYRYAGSGVSSLLEAFPQAKKPRKFAWPANLLADLDALGSPGNANQKSRKPRR